MNTALTGAYVAEEDRKRREAESAPRQDSLLDTIGKIALAAGATAGAVVAGRRLARGKNTSATFDLSKFAGEGVDNLRRAAAEKIAPQDLVPPSRPVPTTGVERQRQVIEDTIRARSERPQGIVTVNLPQPKTALDPWTGLETITDPFGVGTVPPRTQAVSPTEGVTNLLEPVALSRRQAAYASAAAKPEAELPRVYSPKGGLQDVVPDQELADVLITDPQTGEVFRRGKSPESFKEQYISLRPALTGQPTDLPQGRTPGTFAEFSQEASGAAAALRREANTVQSAGQEDFASQYLRNEGYKDANTLVDQQVSSNLNQVDQFVNAVNSAEDQQTGRVKLAFQRNEDENLAAIELAEDRADAQLATLAQTRPETAGSIEVDAAINTVAAQRPDGMPLDQAEGLAVIDLRNKQVINLPSGAAPKMERIFGLSQESDDLTNRAQDYLRRQQLAQEIDTDFDYSAENRRQAAQVQDRIQWAQKLTNQAEQIIAEARGEVRPQTVQLSPEAFAKSFNQQYREEINPALRMVDNARQRAELLASQAKTVGEDLESLLLGESSPVETTMRGKALRGGKINAAGDIVYQDVAGTYASADTGLKTRQAQGEQFAERARRLNKLSSASDEDLTYLVLQGQQARANNQPISQIDSDTYRFASEILRGRALKNPEPTRLQLDALDRARASIASSQRVIQELRNQRPTLAPGPQQDVARAMETLRRGMIVEPSEPLPVLPSIQQARVGFVTDVDPAELKKMTSAERVQLLGPVVGASDVYTGAAAEAAGPVIFTGKSKANTVLTTPPITGSVRTSTGRYLTQDNPDVLGTVYNVAGTPANRAISAQIEQNAQDFLQDAIAGGLQQKVQRVEEPYRTPGTYGVKQFNLLTPPLSEKGLSQYPLGLTGQKPSQRTLYAQYQPGRSVPVPRSPFIGEMTGGTVVVVPPEGASTGIRRDIGAPSASIDLTRRGEKSRYYSDDPAYPTFTTGMEPAPIGPLTQSPGLSRIGGLTEQVIRGAGGIPTIQQTTQGQKIAYPRMAKPTTVPGYGSSVVTNIPRYGINPGAEDWREDLMRSAYRRGGPIRTYQG